MFAGCGSDRVYSLASKAPIARTLTVGRIDILWAIQDSLNRNELAIEETIRS